MNIELQVGVKILLKNKEGKYLLLKRSAEKYPEVNDLWDIVGGRIDAGVSLFENLKREVKEEINLDLEGEQTLIAAQDILKASNRHIVRLTYLGTINGEPELDSDHTEFGWFTMEEIKTLDGLDVYFKELVSENKF
ncbi:NUDIX hydrolase [Patescibacteria group bacterium]|nr:NUDIX hydrolase [Patescibacteria group bacterium]